MILDAIENLMEGRTSFMIAHRLSTVREADLILVLNHGQLVEQGSHDELLTRKGLYYQLYEAQTGRAAAIEAQYAQEALAGGDAERGVSDIIAEVATAEALARYEGDHPEPDAQHAAGGNGAPEPVADDGNAPAAPARGPGLWAPIVPQPGARAPVAPRPNGDGTPNGGPVNGDQSEVTEKVIETLTDAVRQRIRGALDSSAQGGTAADRRPDPGGQREGDAASDDSGG